MRWYQIVTKCLLILMAAVTLCGFSTEGTDGVILRFGFNEDETLLYHAHLKGSSVMTQFPYGEDIVEIEQYLVMSTVFGRPSSANSRPFNFRVIADSNLINGIEQKAYVLQPMFEIVGRIDPSGEFFGAGPTDLLQGFDTWDVDAHRLLTSTTQFYPQYAIAPGDVWEASFELLFDAQELGLDTPMIVPLEGKQTYVLLEINEAENSALLEYRYEATAQFQYSPNFPGVTLTATMRTTTEGIKKVDLDTGYLIHGRFSFQGSNRVSADDLGNVGALAMLEIFDVFEGEITKSGD